MKQSRHWKWAVAAFAAVQLGMAGVAWALIQPESIQIPAPGPRGEDHPENLAVFPHWAHADYKCYVCHPAIFPQRKMGFTHDQMDEGRYCGACHDGKTAFSYDDDDIDCEICHHARGE